MTTAARRPAWRWEATASSSCRLAERNRLAERRLVVRLLVLDAVALMRHITGAQIAPHHLQEAEAHQVGAERNAQIDDPARQFELRRGLIRIELVDIDGAERADDAGEQRTA